MNIESLNWIADFLETKPDGNHRIMVGIVHTARTTYSCGIGDFVLHVLDDDFEFGIEQVHEVAKEHLGLTFEQTEWLFACFYLTPERRELIGDREEIDYDEAIAFGMIDRRGEKPKETAARIREFVTAIESSKAGELIKC